MHHTKWCESQSTYATTLTEIKHLPICCKKICSIQPTQFTSPPQVSFVENHYFRISTMYRCYNKKFIFLIIEKTFTLLKQSELNY